ncbi:unnamed protein product [Sphagnum troendelagicum]
MAESRAEIDTAAPFASVKDALNIFGEGSCTRRMASLEAELHLAHIELTKLKEQLAASENNKDLCTLNEQLHDESTCHLEEKENLQEDLFPAAEDGNDSWQAQLDAALEQQRNTDDQETVRKEIELLQAELDVVNREYASTAANLACALNDIQSLREGMQGLIDAKALAEGQAGHFSTVAEMSAKRVDELTKDLSAMEESLSKANESRMEAEREFRTTLAAESKRLAAVANNAAAEVANLDEKVKETEAKLVSAIADLEKMEQELSSTKEREQNALKAEARASAIQLEDTNAKLKKATEQETCLLASLASLKAELKNMSAELVNAKRETEDANARVEEVKNQSCAALETAALEEAKTKESLSSSMAALQQVTAQAEEAKAAAAEAIKDSVKLRQELEQAMAHTSTLESRLQAALMETEAARASEAMALQEIKYIKEKESTNRDNVQAGQEVTHSHEEYEVLTRKMHEAEELANKRVAAAIAQADAAKAVEREMQSKMDAARKLIECSQTAMREAIERAEAAEAAKSAVEGELRRWRDDGEQRRKAAVEAVIQAVSRNGAVKSNLANGSSKTLESTRSLSYAMSQNSNSTIIKDQEAPETLALALQHKFPGENKAKKNIFVTKFGPYFYKKIK